MLTMPPTCHATSPDVNSQTLGRIVLDEYMDRAALALEVKAKDLPDGTPLDIKPVWLSYRLACALNGRRS